jgi:hypothetical protein
MTDTPRSIVPADSPLRASHRRSCQLGKRRSNLPGHVRSALYGRRAVRFPLLALTTAQDMGPARHALAQRVVSGAMDIRYPFKPKRVPPAPPGTPAPRGAPPDPDLP